MKTRPNCNGTQIIGPEYEAKIRDGMESLTAQARSEKALRRRLLELVAEPGADELPGKMVMGRLRCIINEVSGEE